MATIGFSKVFILDKYFTELQKFWETEKKLQGMHIQDASSSNEAVHLQQKLKTLSSELVTLRNHLHVNGQPPGEPSPPNNPVNNNNNNNGPQIPPHCSVGSLPRNYMNHPLPYPNKPLPPHPTHNNNNTTTSTSDSINSSPQSNNNNNNNTTQGYYVNQSFQKDVLRIGGDILGVSNCSSTSSPPQPNGNNDAKLGVHVLHPFGPESTSTNSGSNNGHHHGMGIGGGGSGADGSLIMGTTTNTTNTTNGDGSPSSESSYKLSNKSVPLLGVFGGSGSGGRAATGVHNAINNNSANRKNRNKRKINLSEIEDLIHLSGPLTEDALIRCLQSRGAANKYSVYMGPILLVTNRLTSVGNPLTLTSTKDIPAPTAVKKVVQEALRQQSDTGYPQAIILSGTSGSGKTYTSMLILRQLFEMAGGGMESDAFKHLSASITVLRSLGTARTILNRESSRVGHFIEVQVTDGTVYRTKVHCYFLDQTRVVRTSPEEKNYDIFYQMLAGLLPEERERLHLGEHTIDTLRYLNKSHFPSNEGEDAKRFREWKTALGMLGIPFLDVVRVLAAVILMGNVQFKESSSCMEMDVEGESELQSAAALLGVSESALKQGLSMRTHNVRNQLVRSRCDANLCNFSRDSLAKSLYCRTVATIVRRANSLKRLGSNSGTLSSDSADSLNNREEVASQHASTVGTAGSKASKSMTALNNAVRHATDGFIGILDMFGFEDVKPSHLEHLCINLCAETMQHFYNTHIFKASIESCRDEGIQSDWEVDYVDNVPCIDLISSLRTGLLSMLDVECSVKGTIESYVQKLHTQHKQNPRLILEDNDKSTELRSFAIQHYAGKVIYDATEFLDTNRDILADDLVAAFHKHRCSFGFASHLFSSELKILGAGGMEPSPRGISFRISPTSHTELLNGDEPVSTLTQDFHTRLDNLLRTLVHAKPHFIRCIKLNQNEQPDLFDRHVVSKQLRAFQVLETVNLMANGYPHRMRFKAFNTRYRLLGPFQQLSRSDERAIDDCQMILDSFDNSVASCVRERLGHISISWALGKRHIFLSEGARQQLESMRSSTRHRAATMIQSMWRAFSCRQRWPILRQGFHLLHQKQQIPPNLPPPNNLMSASAFLPSFQPPQHHQQVQSIRQSQNHNSHTTNTNNLPSIIGAQIKDQSQLASMTTTTTSTMGPPPPPPSLFPGGNSKSCPSSLHTPFANSNTNNNRPTPTSSTPNQSEQSQSQSMPHLPPPLPNPNFIPKVNSSNNSNSRNNNNVAVTTTTVSSSVSGGGSISSSMSPPMSIAAVVPQPPNAPRSVCSSVNSNVSGGRPRPQPITGTPPPGPEIEKCDPKLVQQTCTLFGLDMERPPPLPPSRSYTVAGNTKLGYPQTRIMKMNYPDESSGGDQQQIRLLKGEKVTVIGTSPRRGHLMVEHKNRTLHLPFQYLELKSTPTSSSPSSTTTPTTE